jgi:hypothetical protein
MRTQNIFINANQLRRFPTYAAAVKHAEKISEWSSDVEARYIIAAAPDGDYFPVFIGNETIELLHSGYAVAN